MTDPNHTPAQQSQPPPSPCARADARDAQQTPPAPVASVEELTQYSLDRHHRGPDPTGPSEAIKNGLALAAATWKAIRAEADAPRALGPLPAPGEPLTISLPDDEVVPGFDFDGQPTGSVYRRADIVSPEKSGVYGQSGNLFLTREVPSLAPGAASVVVYAVAVRNRSKKSWPGAFDYTASGMSDAHETELDTALREAREELGVSFTPDRLTKIAAWVPRDGFWSRGAVFAAPWAREDVPFNPDDIEGVRWMTAAELQAAARRGDPMKSDMRNYLLSRFWPPQ